MTIAIAVAVPDGIALAADTQTTWTREITQAKVKGINEPVTLETPFRQPIGWSSGARKLFPFDYGSHKGAIITAGTALIGDLSARAVFKKLEQQCPKTDSCEEVVQFLANGIKNELRAAFQVNDLAKSPIVVLEFVFASFENNDITKPYLSSNVVFSGTLVINGVANTSGHIQRWHNSPGRYSACWIGRPEYIAHIVNHNNPNLPPISGQYHFMTLEDAINYATFLAEFTCDFQNFAVTVPDCGKPVVAAVLTPEAFTYVKNAPAF